MKYKNFSHKKRKSCYPLEISCANCKTAVAIYQKAGKGNLIKMVVPRIIESEIDLTSLPTNLKCPVCQNEIARKGNYNKQTAFWIIRGRINTRRLKHYHY